MKQLTEKEIRKLKPGEWFWENKDKVYVMVKEHNKDFVLCQYLGEVTKYYYAERSVKWFPYVTKEHESGEVFVLPCIKETNGEMHQLIYLDHNRQVVKELLDKDELKYGELKMALLRMAEKNYLLFQEEVLKRAQHLQAVSDEVSERATKLLKDIRALTPAVMSQEKDKVDDAVIRASITQLKKDIQRLSYPPKSQQDKNS